jgi:hypothetical protein
MAGDVRLVDSSIVMAGGATTASFPALVRNSRRSVGLWADLDFFILSLLHQPARHPASASSSARLRHHHLVVCALVFGKHIIKSRLYFRVEIIHSIHIGREYSHYNLRGLSNKEHMIDNANDRVLPHILN